MKGSGKQYRTCWPGMLFFCCYWSLCDGEGFVNRSCWKIFEGAIFHQKMLEHLMWMSDFELTSYSRTDFRLAQFSILICLAWRDALPGFAYLEITLPCKLPGTGDGTVGSPGLPTSQAASWRKNWVSREHSYFGVFSTSASNLPAGSLEAPGELVLPGFLLWTWRLGSAVQGSRLSANAGASSGVQKST